MGSLSSSLYGFNGLGAVANQTTSEINTGVTVAGAAVAATLSTVAGSAALAAIGLTSLAIPFIGPVVAGITLLISALGVGGGCGQTCTASTQIVNQVEPYCKQNLVAAQQQAAQNGGCLTAAEITALTGNYDLLWNEVLSACGKVPAPGGTQCISDRQRGGKYDWASYYRDPITAFPVCPDQTSAELISSAAASGSTLLAGLPSWALPAALIVAGLLAMKD